jgi:serine/threonine protein kinase
MNALIEGTAEGSGCRSEEIVEDIHVEKEFSREVECLMKVRHKNIVRFLGYCFNNQGTAAKNNGKFIFAEKQQRLLCFEYLPKGSLQDYIAGA